MTVHSYHPGILEHGLADGCERCQAIAANPVDLLDDACLLELASRVHHHHHARSSAEAAAMSRIEDIIRRHAHLRRIGAA
jgi:hypothetical protein